jgi:glutamyl-tRNA reductase
MRYDPKQSYEEWANRVRLFEQGAAMQRIAMGDEVDQVMRDMAKKITDKMLHPILKDIHESSSKIDLEHFEQSKQAYFKQMERIGPVADHVVDDLIQTDQLRDPKH